MFVTAGTLSNLVYSTFLGYPIGLAAKEKMSLGASIVNIRELPVLMGIAFVGGHLTTPLTTAATGSAGQCNQGV
jgi:hypothetical protein